ncbi:MAG: hypothetical protein JW755_09415 [Candidatus Aminicenantes bacterium]|nr:hypothetical protein [Candidatus Aminicenantes bacterium]
MQKTKSRKIWYFIVTRLLDLSFFIYLLFGKHGLGDIPKIVFGSLYIFVPLFIFKKCPLHVFFRWLFEGKRDLNFILYAKRVFGQKQFVLMLIFYLLYGASFLLALLL